MRKTFRVLVSLKEGKGAKTGYVSLTIFHFLLINFRAGKNQNFTIQQNEHF